ncbi:porin [Craterilacuibacter sinensis]|uniref:Porin n=1 Tax=Craterilacuibacter sinensis TaxID=2686017 RepID=A0A845BJW8_9NEIS|nr:porin [Craterilacuibacter sinensis]MXR35564.1 porin [Craterilacuibacter sinensis]
MKKVLIAALVSALPAAAMADVTVYGIMKAGVENVKVGKEASATNVDDLGSRIGFKGSEDLGNGLKAIWQVETALAIDDGKNGGKSWASRDSFAGLSSEFGTVKLGYNSNFANSDMGVINAWENGSDALGLSIFTRADARLKDSIRLESPEYAGFKAVYVHGVDENKNEILADAPSVETYTKNARINSLGLQYEIAGLTAQYMYQVEKDAYATAAKKEDTKQHRVELSYDWNNWFFGAGYAQTTGAVEADKKGKFFSAFGNEFAAGTVVDGQEMKARDAAMTVAYTYGAITPKFSYAHGWDVKVDGVKAVDTAYDQFIVGADYSLSKRTLAGVSYGKINYSGEAADVKAFGVNLIHKF